MGNAGSNINNSERTFLEIQKTIRDLIYDYDLWTNEEICKNLEIVYFDKLIKFNQGDLVDISAAIGYGYKKEVCKEDLCKLIITHYKKRINLLKIILKSIEQTRDKLFRAKTGPVCKGVDDPIEDFLTCTKIPYSLWIDQKQYQKILVNLKNDKRYEIWKFWINKLDKTYYLSLKKLLRIIKKIKQDVNNSMNEEEFNELENYTKFVLEDLSTLTDIYYLLAINII